MRGGAGRSRRAAPGLALAGIVLVVAACGDSGGDKAAPPKSLREQGAVLYQQNCFRCHGGAKGGDLRDIPPPHNSNGHTWHHPDQQLADMILNGIPFSLERERMPAFAAQLNEGDIQAILAYIKTLWTGEQRAWQATVTAQAK